MRVRHNRRDGAWASVNARRSAQPAIGPPELEGRLGVLTHRHQLGPNQHHIRGWQLQAVGATDRKHPLRISGRPPLPLRRLIRIHGLPIICPHPRLPLLLRLRLLHPVHLAEYSIHSHKCAKHRTKVAQRDAVPKQIELHVHFQLPDQSPTQRPCLGVRNRQGRQHLQPFGQGLLKLS